MKINGEMRYLWRADHEGEVLASLVTTTPDKAAALKLIKRIMKRHGWPQAVVTDGLRSYGANARARSSCSNARSIRQISPGRAPTAAATSRHPTQTPVTDISNWHQKLTFLSA